MPGEPPTAHFNLRRSYGKSLLGLTSHGLLKAFFGGNAILAVIVLLLITFFLFREGLTFFPQYREDMELYRRSGMEYAGLINQEQQRFNQLFRQLTEIRKTQIEKLQAAGMSRERIASETASMQAYLNRFSRLAIPLRDYQIKVRDMAMETYQTARLQLNEPTGTNQVTDTPDFAGTVAEIRASMPELELINTQLERGILDIIKELPRFSDKELNKMTGAFREEAVRYVADLHQYQLKLEAWQPAEEVGLGDTMRAFLLGRDWVINIGGHSSYGLLPLFTGSLLVTSIAIILAIPLGVGAAIYTNQMAAKGEASVIKPFIEFITAIPTVVVGFFGIAVFGTAMRWLSQQPMLEWLPGFPIIERLNAFTAGCLLALMAVPTVFTLSEDALNRVPRIYRETSLALGATRFQTTMRIVVPTAISGIVSAVLLGIGRVIGETMIVLLCAGNRIRIPDFSEGLGLPFQPVHTMTGIIAQEMGEVAQGTIHYRALFCVGVVLFVLTLLINIVAQKIFHHYRVGE